MTTTQEVLFRVPLPRSPERGVPSGRRREGWSGNGDTEKGWSAGERPTRHRLDICGRFGERLRRLRRQRGWTQARMADLFGIDRSYISEMERGNKAPSLPMLEILAVGLRVSLADLLREL